MLRLTDEQWELIRKHFPEEHIPDDRPGRKPIPARKVLEAVLWILNTGAQWHMLPQSYPNYKTVHRRFQQWCENEVIRAALTELANVLREQGAIDESECYIDATFASAKGGGDEIGPTRRGKGVKIMAIVDRHGLPLAVTTYAANHHEVTLVQLTFDFYMIEAKPDNLIGDRAYDSDQLDAALRAQGTEMISPHRSNENARHRMVDGCAAMSDAGSSNASLPGFSGNAGSWFAGSTTQPISSASCSLQPYASCSSNFEIGSTYLSSTSIHESRITGISSIE